MRPNIIPVAQRIERWITNPKAAGLNPAGDASLRRGSNIARPVLTPAVPVTVASTINLEMAEWPEYGEALAC
jgi:hypothetical protein